MFEKKLDFKDIKFPVKISDTHIFKKRRKNCIGISVLGYKNKSKNTFKKHVDILYYHYYYYYYYY